ncbi:hypothetical protein A3F55_01370 [Candidatus Adlerbacteria bacterium RIFCSPHIGHO2_12_FULL_53_18]|uniref:Uncharacterized protein n=1 Tax=Candidatus Adlerbacteria bacterium RIFCSPHIGHO2_12_FULL_53_18 TaxID=1797242 RepID=A0A1F4XU64_9BACT|nr:MAG: hypothetical protein A3F55_01370 [Candidatus Adlerbacteria bacterium RIFCSPHIGHO2_12_FULL_53_18]
MTLSWSARRQLLYYAVGLVMATILLFALWQTFLTATPTCFDGSRNGSETDIDCGGSCAKLCEGEAKIPNILWARSLESAPQTYTAVAYVENRTEGAGARQVPYLFQIFDDKNELVVEQEGATDLPPVAVIPVVLPNINVGNRVVARTLFRFTAEPVWERVRVDALPQVRITGQQLAADGTRLSAVIINDGFEDVRNLRVAGVVFDTEGVVRAASVTLIDRITAKASQPAVFTWGDALEGVARAEITVLPSF